MCSLFVIVLTILISSTIIETDCAALPQEVQLDAITENYTNGPPCRLNTDDLDNCILQKFQNIIPKLKDGVPELNILSVDPYFFKKGLFRYANEGVEGGLLLKNMNIHGISKIRINDFKSNFTGKQFVVRIEAMMPNIIADGSFKADVKFGGLRLVPKGHFNITINNIRAIIKVGGLIADTENGERVQLNNLDADVALASARITANGIFSDRNLNNMILNLINENIPEIVRVGIPHTRSQWAPIFIQHINNFFAKVPLNNLIITE